MAVDDYSPMYVGDLAPAFSAQFSNRDGTAMNLTGASFSLVMLDSNNTRQIGQGTWVIDSATGGQAHYNWASADTAVPGLWMIQVSITISGQTQHCDPKPLTITAPL